MTRKRSNPDYLNGVPELVILQLLARQPMYGYELVQAIRLRSGEVLEFGEGSIYPTLHKLEKRGLLSGRRETVNGRNRVIYRTTAAGSKRLQASVSRWQQVTEAVSLILEGEPDARAAIPQ